jgi:membrane protease YdiL (CAAX protease family)
VTGSADPRPAFSSSPALVAALTIGPTVGEERLLQGLALPTFAALIPAGFALGLTTVLFAAAHVDLQHVVAVLPLSAWLTWIAWRTGSIRPAMLAHWLNNLLSGTLLALELARTDEFPGWLHAPAWGVAFPLLVRSLGTDRRRPG